MTAGAAWGTVVPSAINLAEPTLEQFIYPAPAASGTAFISQVISETIQRRRVNSAAQAIPASGDLFLQAIHLIEGQTVSNLGWLTGSTAATGPTHQWLCITDGNRNLLAVTADQTNAAIAASTPYAFAIAKVNNTPLDPANGSLVDATSFVAPYTGWYYIGLLVASSTTQPTASGNTTTAAASGIPPIIAGTSTTGLTAPPTVATQFATITAGTALIYAVCAE